MNGKYTVLDISSLKQGKRLEIWHGWGWTPEKRADFENRRQVILEAAHSQLAGYRIFIADVGEPRVRARLEAAIMNQLYQQPPPFCDIPDREMSLAPRRKSETPIVVVENKCQVMLHGLPDSFEI